MGTISYTIPTAGSTLNSIADPEVSTALQTILTWANGNIDGANVSAALTGRRLVAQASAYVGAGVTNGNYVINQDGTLAAVGAATSKAVFAWYLDPANYTLSGKSNTLLIGRMTVSTANAPVSNIATRLASVAPVTATGPALGFTVSSFPAGEAAASVTPSADTANVVESGGGAFTFPTAGLYAPVVIIGTTTAAGSALSLMWQLFALNT